MIGHLLRVAPAQLRTIVEDPDLASELAYPDDGTYPEPPRSLDLDKSWHLIHFLLAGEAWGGEGPLAAAILGGEELVDTDAGYGPFRYLLPEQVRANSEALQALDADELWSRFDAERANAAEIYPSGWTGAVIEQEDTCENYNALRRFYAAAAADGDALLLYIG